MASAGIMRAYLINPCNMYFTLDRKVRRFLETALKIYNVANEKIEYAIGFVSQFDMKKLANEVLDTLFEYIINRTYFSLIKITHYIFFLEYMLYLL